MALDLMIAGPHNAIYDFYYKQADPGGSGIVPAPAAAAILKKSGLPQNVLHHIWTLSDSDGKGHLDRKGFYVSLKLVSLAQYGCPLDLSAIQSEVGPPKMDSRTNSPVMAPSLSPSMPSSLSSKGNTPNITPTHGGTISPVTVLSQGFGASPSGSSLTHMNDVTLEPWSITEEDRTKYDAMFASLNPHLPIEESESSSMIVMGDRIKPFLLNTKLPLDVLGKIWEYSDIDKDGALDSEEFALTMNLVQSALKGEPLPPALPLNLIPPKKRLIAQTNGIPVIATSPTPGMPSGPSIPPPAIGWVVSAMDKALYDQTFKKADQDMDGFVNGAEIKDIFLQSGLPQNILAHIWALSDRRVPRSG
jgi:epidermal growth factor receptor substrate 15